MGELRAPNITGLNNGNEGMFSVFYDSENSLSKSNNLGLIRKNSIFFFNASDQNEESRNQQLAIIWEKIYRPEPASKTRNFELDSERVVLLEGSVESKRGFIKVNETEGNIKKFLNSYSLKFEDGITQKLLCEQKPDYGMTG